MLQLVGRSTYYNSHVRGDPLAGENHFKELRGVTPV